MKGDALLQDVVFINLCPSTRYVKYMIYVYILTSHVHMNSDLFINITMSLFVNTGFCQINLHACHTATVLGEAAAAIHTPTHTFRVETKRSLQ